MPSIEFFKSKILPQAIASGSFGKNAELVQILEDSTKGQDQFASSVLFVEIEVRVGASKQKFSIICKFQCENAQMRERFRTDFQFWNEVLVYQEIMPMFPTNVLNILPEFYFGVSTLMEAPENDVVILENLIPSGYRLTKERAFLDYDHCALALRKLAEFHAASLLLKSKCQLKFANKINELKETRWYIKAKEEHNRYFGENAKRGIIPLVKSGKHPEILNYFMEKLSNVFGIMTDIFQVNEMSVLCHGDFCRNNMVFKYEEDHPVDVKFFDLATARYGSPIIDISFFLFLNMSLELRREHFKDELFKVYSDTLQQVAGTLAPSLQDLWKEFQQKAIYGYILASFFLPIMLDDNPIKLDAVMNESEDERIKKSVTRGGEKVTKVLSELVIDLVNWGCLTCDNLECQE
uniref:CHK kinase-like domain-containing protein n=1 Tax=Cuerna arida TaxID=1464854 RepID=A0A1B6G5H6_9HEMI